MAKTYPTNVDEHLDTRNHPLRAEINEVRKIIKEASSQIKEHVKWNGPSFYMVTPEKDYDFGNINLHQESFIQFIIVYYKGLPENDYGILTGTWKDRREIRFTSLEDIENKAEALKLVVQDWVKLTQK